MTDLTTIFRRASVACLLLLAMAASGVEQVIAGNPLNITAADNMQMIVTRLQPVSGGGTAYVQEYYDTYMPFLVLTPTNGVPTTYSPYNSSFSAVSNSKPDAWTIRTVATADGADAVSIAQTVTYNQGTQIYRHAWTITNGGATTYSASSFRYGGDTYFSGSDSANGFYSADLGMVYCTNSNYAGLMGLFGGVESPASHYREGAYQSVWASLGDPSNHLSDTVDPSFIDNGMGLEWVTGPLAPGGTITIVAYEKWTDAGFVQVLAPQEQATSLRSHLDLEFTIQNLRSDADTVSFTVSTSAGLTATAPAQVQIPANSSLTVIVPVDVGAAAAGTTGTVVLEATSATDDVVTRDTARLAVAAAPSFPVTLPGIPVSGRGQTVFGPICSSTPQGVDRLLAALRGRSDTEAVCYAWDATAQGYVKLPAQPTGGLLESSGAFLATRIDLGLDFSGTPASAPADLVLLPGWNFVGVPLLDDDGTLRTSHDFFADFELLDHLGALISGQAQIADTLGTVGSGDAMTARPFLYDGRAYGQVGTMTTGRGYWIKNNTADDVTLRRLSASFVTKPHAAGRAIARAAVYHDRGAPPAAPGAEAKSDDGGGGCGGGSGIACLLAGFGWLALRRRAA